MSASLRSARHPIWLLLAGLLSLLGSAALWRMGRAAEGVAGAVGGGPAALGLLSLVILLGLAGVVLGAMAVKELADLRRQEHLG